MSFSRSGQGCFKFIVMSFSIQEFIGTVCKSSDNGNEGVGITSFESVVYSSRGAKVAENDAGGEK